MIFIKLNKLKDAINEFNPNILSDPLDSYINRVAKMFPLDKLSIKIEGRFTSEEQKNLETVIHDSYKIKKEYLSRIDNYDHVFRLSLFLVGVILILLSYMLKNIFSEISLIAGWVIIWEVIYDILFNIIKRKRKKRIYEKLSKCRIVFKENENE